ncbi:hypothetical protein [Glycomyces tarimensis]
MLIADEKDLPARFGVGGASRPNPWGAGHLENCQTIANAVFGNGSLETWMDFRHYLPKV